MKTVSVKIAVGIFSVIVAFSSCDEIAQPIKSAQTNSALPTVAPTFKDSSAISGSNSYTNYKLLLEGLGGHFCINCARAALHGDSLINPQKNTVNAANIIYIDENSGFESPSYNGYIAEDYAPAPGEQYYAWAANYQTVAGNTWNPHIFNPPGYPEGSINRRNLLANMILDTRWDDTINTILTPTVPTAKVTINIHDSVWIGIPHYDNLMGATFQVNVVSALPAASYYLQTVIIEDSIFSGQSDGSVDSGYITHFCHNNVLRGAIGNNTGGLIWGTQIPSSVTGTAGQSWTLFQTYDFNLGENGNAAGNANGPAWNLAHCYIIAFVYEGGDGSPTQYQVVQAEMIKLE